MDLEGESEAAMDARMCYTCRIDVDTAINSAIEYLSAHLHIIHTRRLGLLDDAVRLWGIASAVECDAMGRMALTMTVR